MAGEKVEVIKPDKEVLGLLRIILETNRQIAQKLSCPLMAIRQETSEGEDK